jgi:hypothetical protein
MTAVMSEIAVLHSVKANYFYAAEGEDGVNRQQVDAEHHTAQEAIIDIAGIRHGLDQVPHNEKRLDTQRMAGFLEQHGLLMKPFVGVSEDGQQSINEIMRFGRGATNTVAAYFPLQDFIYVLRGLREGVQGIKRTEADVVHEQFHANNPFRDILTFEDAALTSGIGYSLLRHGFVEVGGGQARGHYHEEAGAQYLRNLYITEELGLSNGLSKKAKPQKIEVETDDIAGNYFLPASYVTESQKTKKPIWHTTAHAAYGLQLMVARDPRIFPAMVRSGRETQSFDDYRDLVNGLYPHLYDTLGTYSYDPKQFALGTHYIIEKLYDGDANEALAAATTQAHRNLLSV